jgi:hypothetical protein
MKKALKVVSWCALGVIVLFVGAEYGIIRASGGFSSLTKNSSNNQPQGADVTKEVPVLNLLSVSTKATATESVIGKGVGPVPGVLICPDLTTLQVLFQAYADYWSESMQDRLTGGQASLIRGQSADNPDPESVGCYLAESGTHMVLENGFMVPVVTADTTSGVRVRGVTQQNMFSKISQPAKPIATEDLSASPSPTVASQPAPPPMNIPAPTITSADQSVQIKANDTQPQTWTVTFGSQSETTGSLQQAKQAACKFDTTECGR